MKEKGIALALLTAFVSGFSVFVNGFGVVSLDPVAYTFLKNLLVAGILAAVCLLLGNWREFLQLDRRQALQLGFIGTIGGGVAFALFFSGLSRVSGAVGSFIYRLLFIFAVVIATIWLKEKINWKVIAGGLAILAGNFLLLGPAKLALSEGMLLVLAATILWAAEYAASKKALENLSPTTVAGARLGLGSIVLLGILTYQNNVGVLFQMKPESLLWIAVATAFLTLFVTFWYSALKLTSLTAATAALTLGGPISAILSLAIGKPLTATQAGGFFVLALGAIFVLAASQTNNLTHEERVKT